MKMLISMLIAAAAAQSAPMVAATPIPREAHVFHDWVVACDNTKRCQAVGVHPEGRDFSPNGVMVIERGPEAEAALLIRLADAEGEPARLAVYGEALPVRLSQTDGELVIEPESRAAFIERVAYADRIEVQDAAGAAIGQVSLAGLRGAMLYMDEVQGRLHNASALIRTGRRPASEIPRPPPVPTVRIAPAATGAALAIPASRIAELRRESRCTIEEVGGPDHVEIAALGGGRTLVLLACGSGAYNVTIVPFVATAAGRSIRIEPAPFDIPLKPYEEDEGRRMLVNGEWDPQSMMLSDFSKGRGFGDCGSRSRYGWDGNSFRLVAREEMPECRGSYIYVTTWRTEVTR